MKPQQKILKIKNKWGVFKYAKLQQAMRGKLGCRIQGNWWMIMSVREGKKNYRNRGAIVPLYVVYHLEPG